MVNVCLTITDYRYVSVNAKHFYGELREHGIDNPERHGVSFEMDAAEAHAFSGQGNVAGTPGAWQSGDRSYRFASRVSLLNASLQCAKEVFGEDVAVYLGEDVCLPLESMNKISSESINEN